MTVANAILDRYEGGFNSFTDSGSIALYGRREAFISLADVNNVNAAVASLRYLSDYRYPRSTLTATIEPSTTDSCPYVGMWGTGATATMPYPSQLTTTLAQVRSITVNEDADGVVDFSPEFVTVGETRGAQTDLYLRRLGGGTLNGRAAAATIARDTDPDTKSGRVTTQEQNFSQPTLASKESPAWKPADYGRLTTVWATILTPGTTATTLQIKVAGVAVSFQVNGSSSTTLTIPAGRYAIFGMATTHVGVTPLTNITCSTTAKGTGAADLSVRVTVGEA
jgi:hypothetical protein